jgi:tRNA A-37 threonylcarbamoyl transferase component Bud32
MRASLNPNDAAYLRTKWILGTGARIIVKLRGVEVPDVYTADEENGIVMQKFGENLVILPPALGEVEIKVSLR